MFPNLSPGTIGIRTGLAESVALAARHGWAGCDLPAVEAAQLAAERSAERQAAKMRELDERRANQLAAKARIHAAAEATQNRVPPWGTKEAKRLEIERVRQEIERRKKD